MGDLKGFKRLHYVGMEDSSYIVSALVKAKQLSCNVHTMARLLQGKLLVQENCTNRCSSVGSHTIFWGTFISTLYTEFSAI